ncbi:hypothetical protein GALL_512780 [mine drainage metagenome]|uniref:Uncharacterized protein n=1 Tax=mine drainage metagenome TaxID=410659 RepID=A0A1J5P6F1_9ZZZZ
MAADRYGGEACFEALAGRRHGLGRRIRRLQHQPTFVENLERHLRRVAVQGGRVHHMIVRVRRARLLHHQQRRRLRQMAVEQFVEFVLHVAPGQRGGGQPHAAHQAEQQQQQPALQGARQDHRGPWRWRGSA